ncbi:MAG: alcohol dehydrogenase catalytic domain-containing protein [Firmicutes bacterium]|jgi:2-desacetyl-2-hydroxyethyl bacteriochlorophyllide A dehydrogenase|nr:alcohol dehydrogenase catalytic domain-containing protein [Bacillota bacterium]MDH7495610.1 alcohol dehydrogenase catalytic domain-containing protein [Bacillota bacterium]
MLAAVLEGPHQLVLRDVPKPRPGPGELVVRVAACGVCQTDYSAFIGARRNYTPPIVMGHEISGMVDETGPGVEDFRKGDAVIVSPAVFCGRCGMCRLGMQHYCENGAVIGGDGFERVLDGGFAEYVRVPVTSVFRKPPGLSFIAAALTEPLAGSYKGLVEYSEIRVGEDVVVIGAGSMGLLVTQIASAAGAGRLVLIDIQRYKLEHALRCGATHVINSSEEDPVDSVGRILPGGPDIVFEAAGVLEAAKLAFRLCRKGTRVNMFGVIVPGTIEVSPATIHFTEIRMDASFSVTPRVMAKAIDLMEKGLVDPEKIVTHRMPLDRIHEAMRLMGEPERIKVVIDSTGRLREE